MTNYQPLASPVHVPVGPLKDSIRDMVRLQSDYQLTDELFWEIFDARVLHDEPLDINVFLSSHNAPVAQA